MTDDLTRPETAKEYVSLSRREVDKRWRPKLTSPLQQYRCTAIKQDNERCTNDGIPGLTPEQSVCRRHGGNLTNVAQLAQAQLEAARMRMLGTADSAIDAIQDLLQPGTTEGVRLKAATEVLDRIGVRGGFEVHVEVEDKTEPAEIVRARLQELAEAQRTQAAKIAAITGSADPEDVMDAEIVGDDEENDA